MDARAAVLSLAALPLAGPAWGAVSVLGNPRATECYHAALAGGAHMTDINTCTAALQEDQLSRTNRAGTLINRGVLQLRLRMVELAMNDFDAAQALAPEIGESYINRGAALIMAGDFAGAVREIDLGLALGAQDPHEAYYNRGLAHEGLGDVYAAYKDYKEAMALKPDWPPPREELQRFTVTRANQ